MLKQTNGPYQKPHTEIYAGETAAAAHEAHSWPATATVYQEPWGGGGSPAASEAQGKQENKHNPQHTQLTLPLTVQLEILNPIMNENSEGNAEPVAGTTRWLCHQSSQQLLPSL